ncbi:MAG: hypothetical protein LBJ99_01365 [Oscillospiraceae bacterium]|jgi:hypothetical protein|nr:hypothetical protein [Oscillospiraceae bacterium]
MAKFFYTLQEYKLITEWADILDWLLAPDGSRFSKERGWGKTKDISPKVRFINRAKKQLGISKDNWEWASRPKLNFAFEERAGRRVSIAQGDTQAEDLVRHIRNGIAHGQTDIRNQNGELWIEIKDFNKSGDKTAYFWIPMQFIKDLHKIYREVENSLASGASAAKAKPKRTKQVKAS